MYVYVGVETSISGVIYRVRLKTRGFDQYYDVLGNQDGQIH